MVQISKSVYDPDQGSVLYFTSQHKEHCLSPKQRHSACSVLTARHHHVQGVLRLAWCIESFASLHGFFCMPAPLKSSLECVTSLAFKSKLMFKSAGPAKQAKQATAKAASSAQQGTQQDLGQQLSNVLGGLKLPWQQGNGISSKPQQVSFAL